jgi:GT2 family glycosyltransferase
VVCTHNGERTIRDCLDGLCRLEYPDYEVVVVDDGSSDATADIARGYGYRVISTENRGLSSARNTGWKAATGEIVAYLDDDAYPDPHWLTYLASSFEQTSYVGMGGPNLPPVGDGLVAECVANAPGGPVHVLLTDTEAEHIPGCNTAFRRWALTAIGGFDPQFRAAGDDVDVCWRLQERGWKIGFNPAAMVWHHRRNSVRAYWKQQRGYGKAEALLERKWPTKYNSAGHVSWGGRIYGQGLVQAPGWGSRVYHGTWGTAPFQSIYQRAPGLLGSLPLMPEWSFVIAGLALLTCLGALWAPLLLAAPLLALALGASLVLACRGAATASFSNPPGGRADRVMLRGLTALLHLLQPLARLSGRLQYGLSPWRWRSRWGVLPRSRSFAVWTERWAAAEDRLGRIEAALRAEGSRVFRGGRYDRWDLEVRGGLLGGARMLMALEDHGAGTQYVRIRVWPRWLSRGLVTVLIFTGLAGGAGLSHAWAACVILASTAGLLVLRTIEESDVATTGTLRALEETSAGEA